MQVPSPKSQCTCMHSPALWFHMQTSLMFLSCWTLSRSLWTNKPHSCVSCYSPHRDDRVPWWYKVALSSNHSTKWYCCKSYFQIIRRKNFALFKGIIVSDEKPQECGIALSSHPPGIKWKASNDLYTQSVSPALFSNHTHCGFQNPMETFIQAETNGNTPSNSNLVWT